LTADVTRSEEYDSDIVSVTRKKKMVQRKKSKIHKVICQTNRDVLLPHVEPDVNASRNILLLMMEIRGFDRPSSPHKCHRGVPVRRHQRSK
jgi:hypothetical protein